MGQKTLYVKGVFLVIIRCIAVEGMLGEIIFVGQKRADAAKLQDARPAEQTARTVKCPGCFASLCSVQGAAHLATLARLWGVSYPVPSDAFRYPLPFGSAFGSEKSSTKKTELMKSKSPRNQTISRTFGTP